MKKLGRPLGVQFCRTLAHVGSFACRHSKPFSKVRATCAGGWEARPCRTQKPGARAVQQHDRAGQALEVKLEAGVATRVTLHQDVQHNGAAVAGRDRAVGGRGDAQLQVGFLIAVQAADDDPVDHYLRQCVQEVVRVGSPVSYIGGWSLETSVANDSMCAMLCCPINQRCFCAVTTWKP